MDNDLLKCVFELRLPCEIGLRPDLVGCANCYKYEDDRMHFDFISNKLYCDDCYCSDDNTSDTVVDKTLLYIIRFIALSEFEKLFYFKISDRYLKKLTAFTESFVAYVFKNRFKSLDYYKNI
jgi:DNA repair protein RecO (recombination protein O)